LDDAEPGESLSSESKKIDLRTHALRVREERGAGSLTFVCLHGFLDGTAVWDGVAPALADLGRVVLIEQRAHGLSSAPEGTCTLDDLAADVIAVLDAMTIARAILVGHALGGIVALKTALAAPDRVQALALISAVSESDAAAAAAWRQVVRAGEVNKLQGLARSVYGPTSRREVDGDGIGLTEIARALQRFGDEPLTPRLAEIRCPTVVIAGERDAGGTTAARAIASHVAGATLVIVPQQDEAPHVGAAAEVAAAIRALASRL
jgi:3-oxoadipate enol-lactonase